VGGVARSVEAFSEKYHELGHKVMIVAPNFDGADDSMSSAEVVRIPAIQNFNGSDFSIVLPISSLFSNEIERFKPDVVHSHHPFLIGSTALRLAALHGFPHVFTHHTMYEQYTH
jgi:glycosyltransferase involved in cell wall biosynthesis